MKIRTFFTCADIDIEGNKLIVKKMFHGLAVKELPTKESLVIVMTFDEVEIKEKELKIVLFSPKDKLLKSWRIKLKEKQNACSIHLRDIEFSESGTHFLKISYDNGEFLGKYPLNIILKKEVTA